MSKQKYKKKGRKVVGSNILHWSLEDEKILTSEQEIKQKGTNEDQSKISKGDGGSERKDGV